MRRQGKKTAHTTKKKPVLHPAITKKQLLHSGSGYSGSRSGSSSIEDLNENLTFGSMTINDHNTRQFPNDSFDLNEEIKEKSPTRSPNLSIKSPTNPTINKAKGKSPKYKFSPKKSSTKSPERQPRKSPTNPTRNETKEKSKISPTKYNKEMQTLPRKGKSPVKSKSPIRFINKKLFPLIPSQTVTTTTTQAKQRQSLPSTTVFSTPERDSLQPFLPSNSFNKQKAHRNKQKTIELNGYSYKKVKTLGKGGYGQVEKVQRVNSRKHQFFVMKILFNSDKAKQNYEIEQTILSILKDKLHCDAESHFLCIEDHGPIMLNGSKYYAIVTKFIDAQDLYHFVPQNTGLTNQHVLKEICIDLIKGYMLIQKAGVIHRDIKPENLLVWKTGNQYHTTYIDFGLSCLANSSIKGSFADCKSYHRGAGTPLYKAPEGIKSHMDIMEGDIYALGVVFYYMAAGKDEIFTARDKNGKTSDYIFYENVKNNRGRLPISIDNEYFRRLVEDMVSYNWTFRPTPEEVLKRLQDWVI